MQCLVETLLIKMMYKVFKIFMSFPKVISMRIPVQISSHYDSMFLTGQNFMFDD